MAHSAKDEQLIKQILTSAKTIAMVGISSEKKGEDPKNLKRKPANVVMKYMQDFGYKVIPVNPFAVGEVIHGETVVANLKDISIPATNQLFPCQSDCGNLDLKVTMNLKDFNENYVLLDEIVKKHIKKYKLQKNKDEINYFILEML